MALVNCPECGKEVSNTAVQCPNCGFGVVAEYRRRAQVAAMKRQQAEAARKKKRNLKLLGVAVVALFLMCGLGAVMDSCQESERIEREAKAKAAEAKKQKKAQAELAEAYAKIEPDLQKKVEALEASLEKDALEKSEGLLTARKAFDSTEQTLERFEALDGENGKLEELRERVKKSVGTLLIAEGMKAAEKEDFSELKRIYGAVAKSHSSHPRFGAFATAHALGTAKEQLALGEEHRKEKRWIKAEAAASTGLSILARVAEDARERDWKDVSSKLERLQKRVKRRAKKAREELAEKEAYKALCGDAPTVDGWDGGNYMIEAYVEQGAHDPGSVDVENCTQPVLTGDNCWKLSCTIRGKNAFGAKVANRGTFWLANGMVVKADL